MPQIIPSRTAAVIAAVILLLVVGCGDSKSIFNPDTGKHATGWPDPAVHGASAKNAAGSGGGLAVCQECHGEDFSGGISKNSCFSCHGVNAPHPGVWASGARTHQTTDQSNAPVCALCHTNGANSPIAPTPPAPAGTSPGCFNNTLCHGEGHPAGWDAPDQHGASAKAQTNGFSGCKTCHGPDFAGSGSAPTCLNTAACHGATVDAPHSPTPWRGGARTHTDTNTGNAGVCADCHALGNNLTSVPVPTNLVAGTPGCFNSTLCHGQVGHPVGWADPNVHGAAAKSVPSATNMQGFSTCQACHGANFAGGTATTCLNTAGCHGAAVNSPHAFPWQSTSTFKHSLTDTANASACGLCHWNNVQPPTYSTPVPGTPDCFDNTLCHGSVANLGCVDCHASAQTGTHGTPRDAVVGEFGLAWGHKRSGRGAVTNADCIVCHLEGNYGTQARSAYHADGNIDLRDPDGAGETPITNMTGGAFTFTKFSTSYAAGSRTSTGHTLNTVDNVLTQKFCLACHDSNGATNTTARTSGGTAAMPFGGVALGAGYTATANAIGTQGLVDVKTQFATTNSSVHPVLGPRNKDFPTAARLNDPYKPTGTRGTSGTKSDSIVLNCFDCHNVSGASPLTTRTVAAHGNAVTIRGTIYVNSPTLCLACHIGTYNSGNLHGTGSAWAATGSSHSSTVPACQRCHGGNTAATTAPARPRPAQDYHGSNSLYGGGLWPTVNSRPYAFIRSWSGTAYHRPYRSSEFTTGSATCGTGDCNNGDQVGDGSTRTYTPGGSY